jgi:hypothetical protein
MAEHKKAALKFREMTSPQKCLFIFKLAICIMTFGMVFPNVMND